VYVLVVRDPEGNEVEYDLVGEVVLGRDETADVQLPDPGVSRRHARLFLEDGLCYVEDLGSANGTLLDDQAVVGQVVLEPGRVASLGPFKVWVEDPSGGAAAAAPVAAAPGLADDDLHGDTLAGMPAYTGSSTQAMAAVGGDPSVLGTLEGVSGVGLGMVCEVRDGTTIGRLPGTDVVVDDPSMSRRHAEIVFADGQLIVRDLGSSNGTFVNDLPAVEQPLDDGDIVTFGSVAFRFTAAAAVAAGALPDVAAVADIPGRRGRGGRAKGGGGMPPQRKLLLGVAGVLVVGMVVVVVAGGSRGGGTVPAPGGGTMTTQEAEDLRTQVFNLNRRAKMLMEAENWSGAEELVEQAVELDPINNEARELLAQTRAEGKMQQLFNEASRLAAVNPEDALEVYMQIEPDSAYRRRARFQVQQIVERITSRADRECRGFVSANRFQEALRYCRRYMDFACQCPDTMNRAVEEALETAERRARVPAAERWRCPPDLVEWMPCAQAAVAAGGTDAARIIGRHFPEPIAGVVVAYHRGNPEEALRELGRLEERRDLPADQQEMVRRLRGQMRFAHGQFQIGHSELGRENLDRAAEVWTEAFDVDAQILPENLQSSMRREATRRLSGAYYERGFRLFEMRRYIEAYEWYRKGYDVNPGDTRIGEGIRRLEVTGNALMRRAQTCGELRPILRFTLDDPPSAVHQQVQELMQRRGC
jgi:ABC transport system ATP-binding/permease protein